MPTYEYYCEKCGNFELVQKITQEPVKTCPTCQSPVKRILSPTAFHLKGSGWYKTDYASSSTKGGSSTNSDNKSLNTDGSKSLDSNKDGDKKKNDTSTKLDSNQTSSQNGVSAAA